ncbi:hypothetical protein C0036_12785, partial [Streptomyces sp. DJ]
MDWLTRLPLLGPAAARLMRTRLWRAWLRLEEVHWARLAAAVTLVSFVSLFPLVTIGAAVGAALLSDGQLRELQRLLADQVPGISDRLDIGSLVDNAGTVGLVAGAALLFTGVGWVGTLRECLRAVWGLEEDPGNPVVRRLADAGVLVGLGGVGALSALASALATTAVGRT